MNDRLEKLENIQHVMLTNTNKLSNLVNNLNRQFYCRK